MEDDAANFDPAGLLIGHAFEGEFLYLRLRGPRDVSYPRGSLAPQITKELYVPHWQCWGEIVGHWDGMVSSHRTLLSVPLRKCDALLGMIVAGRLEVRPFTDKQRA
jgi:hypothetical protein